MIPQHTTRHPFPQHDERRPMVSFIVPCYKLGHFLAECVDSILTQTYRDLEVLVLDDCSPDDTPNIANSIHDPRVKYIRNQHNVGHLRNYNKGIALSRGRYVWLISADDRLRRPYILERYVYQMEKYPNAGYICCPGIGLQRGQETGPISCGYYGARDRVFNGRQFIAMSLRKGYGLLAPSVMVRRECYDRVCTFPLDMPHQGDWYLWFRWALEYDVAYLCEPMVNYRDHDLNIMKDLVRRVPDTVFQDGVNVLWRTKTRCEQKGFRGLARQCEHVLAAKFARAVASDIYHDDQAPRMLSLKECNHAIHNLARNDLEYKRLHAVFHAYLGNAHWRRKQYGPARRSYALALSDDWKLPSVWLKGLLLISGLGWVGSWVKSISVRNFAMKTHLARDSDHQVL